MDRQLGEKIDKIIPALVLEVQKAQCEHYSADIIIATRDIEAAFQAAGYRRLPEEDHLLPDSDRREIIDYLLKSMPGPWKQRDIVEICVRTLSQICLDKLRGKK